jgi:hypothetical protein
MQTKTTRKSFWQLITAIIGVTLIVGTGSAQTVTIDSAPSLNLRTALDNSGLALSSISIDPTTGNAQVSTTSNVTTCGVIPGARSVVVTSPGQATQNATISVSWAANNFVGATTCNVSLGSGSAVPASGWTGTGLPYPATSSLSVTLGSTQPASYNFVVQCFDTTTGPSGSSTTNVPAITDPTSCTDPEIGKWRGTALSPPGNPRIWETTFVTGGQTFVPFPGVSNTQFSAGLGSGTYDAMRFTVPVNAPVGARYDLSNFVSTQSGEGVLAGSVSPCQGDFRESFLSNTGTRKFCISLGGVGGVAIGSVVDAGQGPYTVETCEIVRGRQYYFNTTFGTAFFPGSGAYCLPAQQGEQCIYKLESRNSRR